MPLIGFIISLTRNNREGASILQVEDAAWAERKEETGRGTRGGGGGEKADEEGSLR